MRIKILGFDWNPTNIKKVELHDLAPDDIEYLFESGNPDVFDHPTNSKRFIALGFISDDRFVLVVFEYDKTTRWIKVITAYEPTSNRWWKIYAKVKNIKE